MTGLRIKEIRIPRFGPLQEIHWKPANLSVVYDLNEQGKTSLVDALIHALFAKAATVFPQATRFENEEPGQVTLSRNGQRVTFPNERNPRSLPEWLGWTEPQLARLLCIRGGELELAARDQNFTRLLDALGAIFSGIGTRLDKVIERVRSEAHLTPTGSWSNAQPEYLEKRIREDCEKLTQLENLKSVAFKAEELERKCRDLESSREQLVERLAEIDRRVEENSRALRVHRYHEACVEYERWKHLQQRITQDYGRYRAEDLQTWRMTEQQLLNTREQLQDLEGELEKLRSEENNLHRQLGDLERESQSLQAEIERARATQHRVESEAQKEQEEWRGKTKDLRSQLAVHQADRDRHGHQRAWAGLFKLALLVDLAATIVFIVLSVAQGDMGWVIATVASLVGVLALGAVSLRLHSQARRLEKSVEEILNFAARLNLPSRRIEEVGPDLDRLERALTEAYRAKLQEASDSLHALERQLAKLQEQHQATREKLQEVRKSIGELHSKLSGAREKLRRSEHTLDTLRHRAGLATLGELEARVRERSELESQHKEVAGALRKLLGQSGEEAWAEELARLSRQLQDEERDPNYVSRLPSPETLEAEILELKIRRGECREKQKTLDREIQSAQQELQSHRARLLPHGVVKPQEVYLQAEAVAQQLRQRLRERLAALLTIQTLVEVQSRYDAFLDESLGSGAGTAAEIFRTITQRYVAVRYDKRERQFLAQRDDGQWFREDQLSTGARAQLLFSLRITFVRRLFGDDSGFLILDDAFLSYDAERKPRAIRVITELAQQGWQVLYFTMDPLTRDLFSEHPGAEVVTLQALTNERLSASCGR